MNNNEPIPMARIPARALVLLIASVFLAFGPWLLGADTRTIVVGVLIAIGGVVHAVLDGRRKTQ